MVRLLGAGEFGLCSNAQFQVHLSRKCDTKFTMISYFAQPCEIKSDTKKKYLHFCHQLNTNITGMVANYINLLKKKIKFLRKKGLHFDEFKSMFLVQTLIFHQISKFSK